MISTTIKDTYLFIFNNASKQFGVVAGLF